MDSDQLPLVETDRPWRLDARTRAAGRRGVAQAREALRQASARSRREAPPDTTSRAA